MLRGISEYKIAEVHTNYTEHGEEIAYVIVKGPKGKPYLVDLKNIVEIVAESSPGISTNNAVRAIMVYGRLKGIIKKHSSKINVTIPGLREIARRIDAKGIIGKQDRTDYYRLLRKLANIETEIKEVSR